MGAHTLLQRHMAMSVRTVTGAAQIPGRIVPVRVLVVRLLIAKGQHWTGAPHVSKSMARGATNAPSSGRTTAAGRRQRSTTGCGKRTSRLPQNNKYDICKKKKKKKKKKK